MNLTIITAILIAVLSIVYIHKISKAEVPENPESQYVELEINGEEYRLEVADTNAKRMRGLMNVGNLPENTGMLFVFDIEGIHPFWMKNTLIPLDIIWLNSAGDVVYLKENAEPCKNLVGAVCSSIVPNKMAKYVIELNSGDVSKLGLEVGDKIAVEL